MAKPNTRSTTTARNTNRADAFLNIAIQTKSGEKPVGGLALSINKDIQAMIIEHADKFEKMKFSLSIHLVDKEQDIALDLEADELDSTTAALKEAFQTAAA